MRLADTNALEVVGVVENASVIRALKVELRHAGLQWRHASIIEHLQARCGCGIDHGWLEIVDLPEFQSPELSIIHYISPPRTEYLIRGIDFGRIQPMTPENFGHRMSEPSDER
jgi:hypothetical protein